MLDPSRPPCHSQPSRKHLVPAVIIAPLLSRRRASVGATPFRSLPPLRKPNPSIGGLPRCLTPRGAKYKTPHSQDDHPTVVM